MPAFLTQLLASFKNFWTRLQTWQRFALLGGITALMAGALGLSVWLSRPDYRVLYSNLGPEDAGVVLKALQADKVPYKIADKGGTIMVPKEAVYDQRIKIAGEGGLVGQGIGFEIFDKIKVGQTDFVQKVNYTRALQGELARHHQRVSQCGKRARAPGHPPAQPVCGRAAIALSLGWCSSSSAPAPSRTRRKSTLSST